MGRENFEMKRTVKRILICVMAIFIVHMFAQNEVQAEVTPADKEGYLECFEKTRSFMEKYADSSYFLGDYKSINVTEEEYNELKQVAMDVTSGCDTQYDKIQAITEYVADRTYYDWYYYTGRGDWTYANAYDVYKEKRTVCEGYANLVQALCIAVDIPCMMIKGYDHAYNGAYDNQNKRWVLTDATWCSKNRYTVEQEWEYAGSDLDWFDFTVETLQEQGWINHEIFNIEGLLYDSVYYELNNLNTSTQSYKNITNWRMIPTEATGEMIKIPDKIEGVTVFCDSFKYQSKVKVLDLSECNITYLYRYGFGDCTSLEKIIFPDTLESIDGGLFNNCVSLKKVDFSNTKIQKIPSSCFKNCTSLESVIFPKTVTSMGYEAFLGCSNIKEIDLSATSISAISYEVFKGCDQLEKVLFPSTLQEVDSYTFRGCVLIKELDLSQTQIKEIPSYCFEGLTNLKTILFPDTLTTLGFGAFYECESMEELDFSNTQIIEIPDNYFKKYSNLKKVLLPKSLATIGESAFERCTSLKEIRLDHTNITYISDAAFYECAVLETVSFPVILEGIGDYAFYNTKITELDFFHTKLKSIGEYAFALIDELVSIKFPATIESLGDYSFKMGYKKDTYVYLPVNSTFDENDFMRTDYAWGWRIRIILRLDESGNVVHAVGWENRSGKWYYRKADGTFATGWIQDGGLWYYLDANGVMATGWLQVGGTWYYLKSSGAMATGWLQVGGTWYYLKSSGAMATGWLQVSGTWYYYHSSGAMATGWLQVGGTWYYFYASGAMAANAWVGGYYLNSSGAWVW